MASKDDRFSTQLEQDPDYLEVARKHPLRAALLLLGLGYLNLVVFW